MILAVLYQEAIRCKVNPINTHYKSWMHDFAVLTILSLIGTYTWIPPSLAVTSPLPNCVRISSGTSTGRQYRTIVVTKNCSSSYYAKFRVISDLSGVLPPNHSCICLPPKQSKTLTVPAKFHLEGCSLPTSCSCY
jgi:hypothetical protein